MYKSLIIIFFLILNNPIFTYTVSDAFGQNGLVVSSKKEASEVGVDILKKGGNAVDAAVGVAFALSDFSKPLDIIPTMIGKPKNIDIVII